MKNKFINSILFAMIASSVMAQTETPDSIKAQELEEVVVEGRNQRLGAKVSTFNIKTTQPTVSQ